MITQHDLNKVLEEVNRVLENIDKRIKVLEEQSNKPRATTTQKKATVQS